MNYWQGPGGGEDTVTWSTGGGIAEIADKEGKRFFSFFMVISLSSVQCIGGRCFCPNRAVYFARCFSA
ncbi:hypothetical protein [Scandinavium manionii]|uniref:hypothetical protein n=1 Tax=Scandinavium manionii TaxID=2926520 RepID=UPI00216642C4|nr:hypothetical protein [Scandinavium manionii]MCS2168336.1 hypothetical protein [Scandinavium manionii]